MPKLKKLKKYDLTQHIKTYFQIVPFQDIISWCKKYINFSDDVSAERVKLDFDQYPYQLPIIKEWQLKPNVIKNITVVAPQQMGKTNCFVVGLLYSMVYAPCQSLIVYPSIELAIATNKTKLKPLMRHIPQLNQQLQRPNSSKSDCYKFSNLVSFYQGAGSKIISKSCKIVIGDEVDAWPKIGQLDNVADLKKRTRSYNNSICFLISTPSQVNGNIWKSFLRGSQGYWHLRCKGCGELTMRSCDTNNLQFESDYNEQLKERIVRTDSIRLICPKCGYEHVEADKVWMNQHGDYIHLLPERLQTAPSFQLGALASQLPSLSWTVIANAQLEAGKRADIEAQITFDNSFRGLPYKRRQIVKEDLQRLTDHCYQKESERLKAEDIQFIFGAVDSMGSYWRYGIFASDINDNIHVIQIGEVNYLTLTEEERNKYNETAKHQAELIGEKFIPIKTLEDVINATYYGFQPLVVGIDAHATYNYAAVQQFIKEHPCMVGYLGTKMTQTRYKASQNLSKNFLVSATHYKVDTIYYLYSQKKRDSQYLFFDNIEEKYLNQIAAVRPDPNTKFGHNPQNWTNQNRADHAFDCIKMGYWVRDLSIENLLQKRFNYCKSARLRRRFEKQLKTEIEQTQRNIENNNSWFEQDKERWFKI